MSESQVNSNPSVPGGKTPLGGQTTPNSGVNTQVAPKTSPKIIPAPEGLQNPTTTKVNPVSSQNPAMLKTVPTAQSKTQPNNANVASRTIQTSTQPTMQFHSAAIDPVAKKHDYFAEQNQKTAAEKTKQKKITKKVLMIGIPLLTIIIVSIVLALIFLPREKSLPPDVDEAIDFSSGNTAENINDLNAIITEAYNPTYSENENDTDAVDVSGNLAAVENIFAATLANPNNQNYHNAIYYAQIEFYASYGFYDKVLEITPSVEPNLLTLEERIRFYNDVYLAYYITGNEVEAQRYYELVSSAAAEREEFGE